MFPVISPKVMNWDQTDKQSDNFIAKGSTAELFTQITISEKIGYLNESESDFLMCECRCISAMLNNLIKARRKTQDSRHQAQDIRL